MKNAFTLYLILSAFVSFAQNKTIDSLLQALKNYDAKRLELHKNLLPEESDTTKVNILNSLSEQYWRVSEYTPARKYADEALAIAQQFSFKNGIANSYGNIGVIYFYQDSYPEALKNHYAALKIHEETGEKKGIAASYNFIGNIFFRKGNHMEALNNYFTSLKIREEIGDKNGIAASYNNIGNIYQEQGNYSEALKNFLASLKIFEEIGDKKGISASYNNIGIIYETQDNYPEALKNHFAALKINEEIGDKNHIAGNYLNIGIVYNGQGNYPEALKNNFTSLKIYEEIRSKKGIATSFVNIGITKLKLQAAREGKDWLVKGIKLAKELEAIALLIDAYEGLARADSALGNYKGAYENHKLLDLFRDSLNNEEATQKTLQTKMQYEFDKKQVADSLKFTQEKEIAAIKLQKQKAYTYGGLAGIAITVILLFLVYRNYKKQHIANQKLKEAQEQLIKSEKMATFGVMASRVSHEILNPLNFVNNFSELAQETVTDVIKSVNEEEKKLNAELLIANLQKINEHSKRAAGIVKQLQEHTLKGSAHEYFEEK